VIRQTSLLAALIALLAASAARADTVEASSTTLLLLGQEPRYRGGSKPELVTVAPVFEILTITARDIENGFSDDLRVVLSTWGSIDLAERRWDAGTDGGRLTGDVTTGYVQAKFLDRRLTLRAGRSMIATGIARMIQLDGGQVVAVIPIARVQLSLSSYAGVPTSQRFQTRDGLKSWNPVGGTLAYGGRVALGLPITGVAGRGLELGASTNVVSDGDETVREEVGADLRLQPFRRSNLTLTSFGTFSLPERRLAEVSAALSTSLTSKLHVTADFKRVEPSLLLSRNSILSVFTTSVWTEFGGGATYSLGRHLHAGVDAHLRAEPGADGSGSELGSDLRARVSWEPGRTIAGLELFNLDAYANGYFGARVWARRNLGKAFVTGDVLGTYFREDVNGQRESVTGTLTAGYQLPLGFTAVLSGSAGMTPYLEQSYDLMAKLAYNQTYRTAEVR
jgi:hypothetical protein